MKELKNWKEISKGYYGFVISANVAYEMLLEYWEYETPIETAKASLCLVGDWYTKDRKSITCREWLGKELPIQELLEIAYKDNKENNK